LISKRKQMLILLPLKTKLLLRSHPLKWQRKHRSWFLN